MAKKTFWPHAITLSIIFCVIACVATIVVSLDYPVQMDEFYFSSKQQVDENINEIIDLKREFEANFSVVFKEPKPKVNEPFNLEIIITPKKEKAPNLAYELLLTRPMEAKFNQKLNANFKDDTLRSQSLNLSAPGRWQLLLKLSSQNLSAFYKFEFKVAQ